MAKIALTGMQFHSFHGYYTEEQSVGNQYLLDVEVDLDLPPGDLADSLDNTINYEDIYRVCESQMGVPQRLIETVGYNILAQLKADVHPDARFVVTIRKLNPLLGGIVENALIQVSG